MFFKKSLISWCALAILPVLSSMAMAAPSRFAEEDDSDTETDTALFVKDADPQMAVDATISVTKFSTITNVSTGSTREVWWNNSSASTVYNFNAVPITLTGSTGCAEITRTWRTVAGNPQEHEVHAYVKNCGTSTINIDIYMTSIK